MIIIGYPGIGKSTLAGQNNYIDLESSNFWNKGKRPDDRYIYYCNIALDLSRQGYVVFVSSHEAVRNRLKYAITDERIICIYPSLELKDEWIHKLKLRWENSSKDTMDKNYKAYESAEKYYNDQIKSLMNSPLLEKYEIYDMDYNLDEMISKLLYRGLDIRLEGIKF